VRLELFSCAGGMAEGFRRAGIRFDIAVDADPVHCDSYERNLGHRPICVDARDILRWVTNLRPMLRTQLVVADPPCTPWSRAGKRLGQEDERDMLGVTVEMLRVLQPTAWMIANVPGLDDGNNWERVVQPVVGGFALEAGYCVDFARLDAADYGVPQHRVRPFWFGHRWGTPCIRWPEPTHGDPAKLAPTLPGVRALAPWVTCRDALGHLPPEEIGRPCKLRAMGPKHPPSQADEPAMTILAGGSRQQSNHMAWPWDRPATTVYPHRSVTTKRNARLDWPWERPATAVIGDRGHLAPPGHHDRWPWNAPATTVDCKKVLAPHGRNGKDGTSQRTAPGAIALSVRAATILQGFQEDWHFAGKSKAARWRQIGQAMPPPLAEAVARAVAEQMGVAQERAA
jgi:site-specific DNA-cytosine methylase